MAWAVLVRGLGAVLLVGVSVGCGSADQAEAPAVKKECAKVVLDGGGGIVEPPDGAAAPECQTEVCNYQSQEGCGDAESCVPTVAGDAIEGTCAAAGTNPRGAACSNLTPCEEGHVCAGGYCRKLCCAGDYRACDEGESCFMTFGYQLGDTPTPTGAWLCYPVGTCSVLDPDPPACKESEDCKLVDSKGSEACVPKSPGKLGESCGGSTQRFCGAGLTCVGQPGAETCRRLCRAEECGEPSCPPEEGTCVHFDRDPAGVGECTPGW